VFTCLIKSNGSGGRDRTGDLRIMMPGFFILPHGLALPLAVKPGSSHQRVSSSLSNPTTSLPAIELSICEDVAPSES
jgi:hypothetical protein